MVALFTVIAGMNGFLSAHTLYRSLTAEYRSKGIAIAESVADSSAEILLNRDLATVQATIDQFAEIAGVAYVFVTNSAGEIVAHTFVPAVPAEIRPQIEESLQETRTGGAIAHTVKIKGLGDIIHIHEPILAGVAGFVHVGMDLGFIRAQILGTIIKQQALIFVVFAIMVALAWLIVRRVSRPLELLADYTQSLAAEDFSAGLPVPEEIEALPRKSRDEVGRLASAFLDMKKTLMVYLEDLKHTTAAKERFESELNIAHDIQMGLVPKHFPPYPERREFDLFATLVPAREVGGDFYDFYFIDDRRLCFAIGDVSDKGVPASLFMAATTTLFRALGRDLDSTAQSIVTRINQEISRENDSCMFVTAFCGVLDTHTGEVEYCNAGHNPPLIISATGVSVLPGSSQLAIGMSEEAEYRSSRLSLAPGDA